MKAARYFKAATFDQSYLYGLVPEYPDNMDKDIIDEWIDDQKIIFQQENEGNFLVACLYEPSEEDEDTIYSFMRFFSLGDKTVCSVDFQSSSQKEMIQKITELLAKKHTF